MRVELTLSFLVLFGLVLAGMRLGWRNRGRRQSALPALPLPPVDLGTELAPTFTGMYVGSTIAFQWQDRIVVHGLGERATAQARLMSAGIQIERVGSPPIFIPDSSLIDARLEAAIAGKVIGEGGLLVVRWLLGEVELDTGLRADDRASYLPWIRAIDLRRSLPQEAQQ